MPVLPRATLVLGGARSGKSRYAETLARGSDLRPVMIATAEAGDDEMAERIARHRADRARDGQSGSTAARWRTVEAPRALTEALLDSAAADTVVVVDCLTLWLTNVLLAGDDVERACAALVAALDGLAGPVILVSNELGLGLVPETPLGRRFRDLQGRLNQQVATAVPRVVFVAAGLPLVLKDG